MIISSGLPEWQPRYLFYMGFEIERKWLPGKDYEKYLSGAAHRRIKQGYLCTDPVIRVRKDRDTYYLTYKGRGKLVREEYNLPLTEEAFESMIRKCEGRVIEKERYTLPLAKDFVLEADIFLGDLKPLVLFEVEFPDTNLAGEFEAPEYFGEEVTEKEEYTNAFLSRATLDVM